MIPNSGLNNNSVTSYFIKDVFRSVLVFILTVLSSNIQKLTMYITYCLWSRTTCLKVYNNLRHNGCKMVSCFVLFHVP